MSPEADQNDPTGHNLFCQTVEMTPLALLARAWRVLLGSMLGPNFL